MVFKHFYKTQLMDLRKI